MNSLCLRTTSSLRVSVILGVVVIAGPLMAQCYSIPYSVGGVGGVGCVGGAGGALRARQLAVRFRAPVAVELPGGAHLVDLFQVEVRDEDFILVAAGLRHDLSARIAEIALAVEFADVPGGFLADAIDGADKIAVGDGVRGLLEL